MICAKVTEKSHQKNLNPQHQPEMTKNEIK